MRISDWSSDVCSSDLMGMRDVRALALIPAAGSLLCAASYVVMFTLPGAATSLGIFAIASFFSSLWYGPGTLAMQRLAGPDAKATALAVALLVHSAKIGRASCRERVCQYV